MVKSTLTRYGTYMNRFLIHFLFLFITFSTQLIGQGTQLYEADYNGELLRNAIESFETDYNLSFAFSDKLVEGKTCFAKFKTKSLEEALNGLFGNSGLDYEVIDQRFILLTEPGLSANLNDTPLDLCGTIKDRQTGDILTQPIYI